MSRRGAAVGAMAGAVAGAVALTSACAGTTHGDARAVAAASITVRVKPGTAIASLKAAHDKVVRSGAKNATILLANGTYRDKGLDWKAGGKGGSITIKPAPGNSKVKFYGGQAAYGKGYKGYLLTVRPTASSLTVQGPLTISMYGDGGIQASGNTASGPVKGLVVRNVTFSRMGNAWVKKGNGYAAVHLHYTQGAQVLGNRFVNLENVKSPGAMHGVYLAFNQTDRTPGSSGSVVKGNTFQVVSGDPIRATEVSSRNAASGNSFAKGHDYRGKTQGNGYKGMFTYWVLARSGTACGVGNTFAGKKSGYASYYLKGRAKTLPGALSGTETSQKCKKAIAYS